MDRPTLSSTIDKYADKLSSNEIVSVYAEELGAYCNELEKELKIKNKIVSLVCAEKVADNWCVGSSIGTMVCQYTASYEDCRKCWAKRLEERATEELAKENTDDR